MTTQQTTAPTIPLANTRDASSARTDTPEFAGCQKESDPQVGYATGADFPARQSRLNPHGASAGGDTSPATAKVISTPDPRSSLPSSPATPTKTVSTPRDSTSGLADPTLALLADVLDDLERTRIANENRLRQLTRSEADADGEIRGFGLDERHPDVARLAALVDGITALEHQAALNLQRAMRAHPLGPWVKQTKGVGEKQAARLLAAIGDPYMRPEILLEDGTVEPARPRTVSELWAYCGYHVVPSSHTPFDGQVLRAGGAQTADSNPDQSGVGTQTLLVGVAARLTRGQRANWSTVAKMRAYLVAESCIKKLGSPFRRVYEEGRAKYADAVHHAPCLRCGPAGKPAQPGTPLSKGHQHARAMRLVAKAILRELWREAKRIHALSHGHGTFGADATDENGVTKEASQARREHGNAVYGLYLDVAKGCREQGK